MCLAQIRDWEVFHKLPLKLGNFIDWIADEAKVVNIGKDEGEISVVWLDEDIGISVARFETKLKQGILKFQVPNVGGLA